MPAVDAELRRLADHLDRVTAPEELFGPAEAQAKVVYHRLARVAHEDRYAGPDDKHLASEAFKRLGALWTEAQRRMSLGLYGRPTTERIRLAVGKRVFDLAHHAEGDLSRVYVGADATGRHVLAKIARDPSVNEMLVREHQLIKRLNAATDVAKQMGFYYPRAIDALVITDAEKKKRQVSLYDFDVGLVTLTKLSSHFMGATLPGRHLVWVGNRLFAGLAFMHGQGFCHGAVTPDHVLVHPATHGVRLVGLAHAVEAGGRVSSMSSHWRSWYPPEVAAKAVYGPQGDLWMAARCLLALSTENNQLTSFLRGLTIHNPARRPSDAWQVYHDWQELAKNIYGARRFVPLELNT